jgi:hypothetical protein
VPSDPVGGAGPAPAPQRGAAITACSLRRVVTQEHTSGLVEGVALLQRGGRLEPIAMRLDAASGRWQVVVLQYAPAAGAPHPAGADR